MRPEAADGQAPVALTSADLRILHEAATVGPWEYREFDADEPRGIVAESSGDPVVIEAGLHYERDLRLIVALRNAAPQLIALLAAAERLKVVCKAYDMATTVALMRQATDDRARAIEAVCDLADPMRGGGG